MTASGKARRAAATSPSETGAEPIRTAETADKSVRSSSAVSRNIIAIIVGTEVRVVAR
jgi:hypothetical protein